MSDRDATAPRTTRCSESVAIVPKMSSSEGEVQKTQAALSNVSIGTPLRQERVVEKDGIRYQTYTHEGQLEWITELMKKDLSEPYSVYTYRYFINNWPDLCWLVRKPPVAPSSLNCLCFFANDGFCPT